MRFARALLPLAFLAGCPRDKPVKPLPPLAHAAYAHYLDGKLAGYRDDWGAAADALTAAHGAAPDQPMVAVELARAQAKAKRDDAARATLATARTKWPQHSQVWLASGDLLAKAAPVDAIKAYRKAMELEPTEERAYLGLAKLEKPQIAMAVLTRLVKQVPTSIEGRYRLGQRLAAARKLEPALAQLRKVLELDPDHIDARLDLARGLRLQGKLPEAIAQTRGAFDRAGQALDLAEELFFLLLEADDQTAAIDLLTLLDDERSDTDALFSVARLYRGLGRITEARAIAQRLSKTETELSLLLEADIDLAVGDYAAVVKRTLTVVKSSERFGTARRLAANAHLSAGDPQAALDALAPARSAKPRDLELATAAAFALIDLKRAEEAKLALAPFGDTTEATFARARVADRAGDHAGAIAACEGLLAAKPDLGAALNLAGYLLADSGQRLDIAEKYLIRARELSPGDPAVLDSYGWLLYKKRDTRNAVRALDRAARFAPLEAEIHVHLAAAWLADGAPRTAAATLDRAVALHPTPAVQKKLDAVRATLPR
ncbi:MAG: tetratricopeptide repeat protein [Deltaproteobacteria bacterium]|nr:tetratricopeptide repeat protein [Deltaproteobacteria bacterium]